MVSTRPVGYQRLAELLIGARVAMALRVAAEHRIADLLAGGPKPIDTLSDETGLPASTLRRLMRALAATGVFEETTDDRFANTDVSTFMRSDVSPSLREGILVLNDDAVLKGWMQLPGVMQSGSPAFPAVNGMSFFQYLAADASRSQNMGKFMTGIYGPEGPKIAAGFDFGRFETLVDVGGGQGHIAAEILKRHPGVKMAVFELPRTAEQARGFLAERGLSDRCEVVAGDFFESLPAGYGAYMMKSVLHDWDDDQSAKILQNCRRAMPADGRVLIVEIVVRPGKPMGHPHLLIDLEMMVTLNSGRERTEPEFAAVLDRAGLALDSVTPVDGSFFSVIEARAV